MGEACDDPSAPVSADGGVCVFFAGGSQSKVHVAKGFLGHAGPVVLELYFCARGVSGVCGRQLAQLDLDLGAVLVHGVLKELAPKGTLPLVVVVEFMFKEPWGDC